MVLGVPLAKLAPLLLKTFTKPFVDSLKTKVRKSPNWKGMFIPMAQSYNRLSVRARLWTQGIKRDKEQLAKSSKLSEEAAIELGAEIVANSVTLVIGIGAIYMQQSISAAQDKKKTETEAHKMERIERGILDLQKRVLDQGLLIETINAKFRQLERTVVAMPAYNKVSTINKPPSDKTLQESSKDKIKPINSS